MAVPVAVHKDAPPRPPSFGDLAGWDFVEVEVRGPRTKNIHDMRHPGSHRQIFFRHCVATTTTFACIDVKDMGSPSIRALVSSLPRSQRWCLARCTSPAVPVKFSGSGVGEEQPRPSPLIPLCFRRTTEVCPWLGFPSFVIWFKLASRPYALCHGSETSRVDAN